MASMPSLLPPIAIHRADTAMRRIRPRLEKAAASRPQDPCACCMQRDACLPCGSTGEPGDPGYTRRRVRRGEPIFRAGADFVALYAVRSGFFKSRVLLEDGRVQVTAFHMPGEIVGMDGLGGGKHASDVIALEDGEICIIPASRLHEPALQRPLHLLMSREVVRGQGVMLLLGTLRAAERVATFLVNLSLRFTARGHSPRDLHLRMTRGEIGSYLGLSLETVSRQFSRFQDAGHIVVHQKHIRIVDLLGLQALMRQSDN